MSKDIIYRQDAIDAAECIIDHHSITPYETMRSAIDHLKRIIDGMPSAEPERKKGKWIGGKCNQCGGLAPFWPMASTYFESDFCPRCGSYNGGISDE